MSSRCSRRSHDLEPHSSQLQLAGPCQISIGFIALAGSRDRARSQILRNSGRHTCTCEYHLLDASFAEFKILNIHAVVCRRHTLPLCFSKNGTYKFSDKFRRRSQKGNEGEVSTVSIVIEPKLVIVLTPIRIRRLLGRINRQKSQSTGRRGQFLILDDFNPGAVSRKNAETWR